MGQHGTHLGPTGPRWAPCWPHDSCCRGSFKNEILMHRPRFHDIFASLKYACSTNPTIHQFRIPQCIFLLQKCAHVRTFLLQNGALWDICQMHCGNCIYYDYYSCRSIAGLTKCQIPKRYESSRIWPRGFEILCDLMMIIKLSHRNPLEDLEPTEPLKDRRELWKIELSAISAGWRTHGCEYNPDELLNWS